MASGAPSGGGVERSTGLLRMPPSANTEGTNVTVELPGYSRCPRRPPVPSPLPKRRRHLLVSTVFDARVTSGTPHADGDETPNHLRRLRHARPPGGATPASPNDPVDAVYAAARDLCANGAASGRDLTGAVFAYNHSQAYVAQVMALAATYASTGATPAQPGGPAATAVAYAVAQIGTPYRWGGSGPGGFDCSGLVQAAYAAAGIRLPRVAQAQYDIRAPLAPGTPAQAGDLVFFGASAADVTHVGLVVAAGQMIDAPHRGGRPDRGVSRRHRRRLGRRRLYGVYSAGSTCVTRGASQARRTGRPECQVAATCSAAPGLGR